MVEGVGHEKAVATDTGIQPQVPAETLGGSAQNFLELLRELFSLQGVSLVDDLPKAPPAAAQQPKEKPVEHLERDAVTMQQHSDTEEVAEEEKCPVKDEAETPDAVVTEKAQPEPTAVPLAASEKAPVPVAETVVDEAPQQQRQEAATQQQQYVQQAKDTLDAQSRAAETAQVVTDAVEQPTQGTQQLSAEIARETANRVAHSETKTARPVESAAEPQLAEDGAASDILQFLTSSTAQVLKSNPAVPQSSASFLAPHVAAAEQMLGVATGAESRLGSDVSSVSASLQTLNQRSQSRTAVRADFASRQAFQQQIVDKIKQIAQEHAQQQGAHTVILKIEPQELGTLLVKLTHRGDQMFARITPETPEVEHALRAQTPEITQALAASGLRVENIHVSIGAEASEFTTAQFSKFLEQGSKESGSQQRQSSSDSEAPKNAALVKPNPAAPEAQTVLSGWVA